MPSRWSARREKFRAILSGDQCIHPGSVHDPITLRIAEEVGFEAGIFAGSVASLTILGAPDLITITLSEFADQALRINRGGELPLIVDADHGYGNALNVMRTVEELENAGIAGMCIEDTELPQPYGKGGKPQLISIEEGAGKMRAAIAARRDPELAIFGRTSARSITGLDDALARARAYEAAGVDAMFVVGFKEVADLEKLADAIDIPIILGSGGSAMGDSAFLASRRVRVSLLGHQPFAAAIQALYDTLKALRDGTDPKDLKGIAPKELVDRVTRAADYKGWQDDYLES
ncbi:MAG: isocitrate lyase/PEP mutase family protein [Alphaproteobacteria bacterium]|jgi:carboxyvinyl-carboxyphosphonate phosphorylmutase